MIAGMLVHVIHAVASTALLLGAIQLAEGYLLQPLVEKKT